MEGILALMIPIVAIVGAYYVSIQKAKYKAQGTGSQDIDKMRAELDNLKNENEQLARRLANLEDISLDNHKIELPSAAEAVNLRREIDFIKQKMEQLKDKQ